MMKSKNLEWRIDRLVYVRGGADQAAPRDRKHIERAEPEMLRLIKVALTELELTGTLH